jgi:hypothetical protein
MLLACLVWLTVVSAGGGARAQDETISPLLEDRPTIAVSILAALRCLKQIRTSIGAHAQPEATAQEELACDIPVNLSETDLDALLRTAVKQATIGDNVKSFAERYSSTIAKTVTNFHGAECMIRLRLQRPALMAARQAAATELQLPAQAAVCEVVTGSGQKQTLSFDFTPRIKWEKGCVSEFWLNMGNIDAGCRMCYVDRLYLTTNLVSMWANKIGPNARELINRQLGGDCW